MGGLLYVHNCAFRDILYATGKLRGNSQVAICGYALAVCDTALQWVTTKNLFARILMCSILKVIDMQIKLQQNFRECFPEKAGKTIVDFSCDVQAVVTPMDLLFGD